MRGPSDCSQPAGKTESHAVAREKSGPPAAPAQETRFEKKEGVLTPEVGAIGPYSWPVSLARRASSSSSSNGLVT